MLRRLYSRNYYRTIRKPQAATDILGLETVTVGTLLQLPRLADEDLWTSGTRVDLYSCKAYEQNYKRSINSVEGMEWQMQRNEKRLSKLGQVQVSMLVRMSIVVLLVRKVGLLGYCQGV